MATAGGRSKPSTTSAPLTPTKGTSALSDQSSTNHEIPHFDATERRREKMRSANGPAGHAAHSPAARRQRRLLPLRRLLRLPSLRFLRQRRPPRLRNRLRRPSTAPRAVAPAAKPVAAKPNPPAAKPTPIAPQPAHSPASGNGASNGSASHHAVRLQPRRARPRSSNAALRTAKSSATSPGKSAAELEAFLINFVVEQTGYPPEVVELDADLEADLGIDSIKKAQLFGELQEYFDVSALAAGGATGGTLSLDDFTTLRHVLKFLVNLSPGEEGNATPSAGTNGHHTASATPPPFAAAPATTVASPAAAPAAGTQASGSPGTSPAELEAFLINFVVEQTGYPAEVVDLDADLEADLGIDSIKKAQLFGELQEYFDVSALGGGAAGGGNLSLDDFTTLRHVLNFLVKSIAGSAAASATTNGHHAAARHRTARGDATAAAERQSRLRHKPKQPAAAVQARALPSWKPS